MEQLFVLKRGLSKPQEFAVVVWVVCFVFPPVLTMLRLDMPDLFFRKESEP